VLAVFAAGSLLGALAPSLPVLIVARVIQGLGGAIFPLAFGIARDALPPAKLSTAIGLLSGSFGVGGAAGLVVSGPIVDHVSWHGIFWLGIAMPLVAIVGVRLYVPPSPARERVTVDWLGALLMAAGMVPLLLAISQARAWGWTAPGTIALIVGGGALLVVWARWELGRREPLIDLRLLARRSVWTVNAVALTIGFSMYSMSYLVPRFVQADPAVTGYGFDASVTGSALYLLPAMLSGLAGGPLAGLLGNRLGARLPLVLGVVTLIAGLAMLAFVHDEPWQVYVGMLLGYGFGLTFALTAMANLIVAGVPQEQTGESTGINTMLRTIGGALGSQVVAALVIAQEGSHGAAGFTAAFAACAGVALLALLACFAVPRPQRAG
jgi:MFS family permease